MSDDKLLNKEQQKELQKILDEINEEAKKVVEDYAKNPSEMSGSVHPTEAKVKGVGVMVGMDSEYLDETKEMDGKNVIELGDDDGNKKDK
tara:strand:- start:148 stop:417 length:270 start_codon:yes stop_codon:yes gene_type:complete